MTLPPLKTYRDNASELPFHVVEEPHATVLRQSLLERTVCKHGSQFPGSLCVSIERCHLPLLTQHPYWVCEKTNGTRFMMYIIRHGEYKLVLLMGRGDKMYIAPMRRVPRDLYLGSVFDGELVRHRETGQWHFVIFDCLCVAGKNVSQERMSIRYMSMCMALGHYHPEATDSVQLKVKKFFPIQRFDEFIHFFSLVLPSHYDTDGFVLTPEAMPYIQGRHFKMYKWKPASEHTIDFLLQNDRHLFIHQQEGRLMDIGVLDVADPSLNGCIVECKLVDASTRTWSLVKPRTDKQYPNDMLTFERTLVNIQEDIKPIEFLALMQK